MASQQVQPKLVIHGGAGSSLHSKGGIEAVRKSLYDVLEEVYPLLKNGASAVDAVVRGCQLLEDDPRFNAGTGSVVQSDGQIRMSASLMDGLMQRFSGAINVSRVQNPIELAKFLQTSDDRVLSDFGSAELLRELHLPIYDPMTDLRLHEWMQERQGNFSKAMADVVAEPAGMGTIGVVALDVHGRLAAGTSTGGKGFERIGRVSDSAMPAGNYAAGSAGGRWRGGGGDSLGWGGWRGERLGDAGGKLRRWKCGGKLYGDWRAHYGRVFGGPNCDSGNGRFGFESWFGE